MAGRVERRKDFEVMSKHRTQKARRQLRVQRVVSCDHYWSYEHAIWQARQDDQSRVAVGRYCSKCGKMQTAVAKDWRPLPKSYVDMRETLKKAISS